MTAILVFFAMLVADALWSRWMLSVAAHRAVSAAFYSAGIIAVGGFTTLAYVDDPRYLLPACLGAWLGTYLSVKHA